MFFDQEFVFHFNKNDLQQLFFKNPENLKNSRKNMIILFFNEKTSKTITVCMIVGFWKAATIANHTKCN